MPQPPETDRWTLDASFGVTWNVSADTRLPHENEVEMSGRRVALIARFGVDAQGQLVLTRRLVWPQLRTIPNDTHASLSATYQLADVQPKIRVNRTPLVLKTQQVRMDGLLTIAATGEPGLAVTRTVFPSPHLPCALEKWVIANAGIQAVDLEILPVSKVDYARGTKGMYVLEVTSDADLSVRLEPGQEYAFGVTFSGRKIQEPKVVPNLAEEEEARRNQVAAWTGALRLECPDPVLQRAFDFAKLRAAESVFETLNGLMHCPGGGTYYAAVWCNDQCEYANPFFPFLGDEAANQAALNSFRLYMPFMGPEYTPIPSSIIAEGLDIWEGAGDRGDAAMYAYGATRFALASGDRAVAEALWPAITWCLEYCRRQATPDGVIASDSDELEGRFSHGKTNLSTSSLTYGALRSAADLAHALAQPEMAQEYHRRADALAEAIERFFGANLQSYATYIYHEGLRRLRSWICLPLAMGLTRRSEGTVAALFSPALWTEDGLRTQAGETTYWDRATLYALRGVFMAGETERALHHLRAYSRRRLLGEHAPYPVEAYPEGNQRQLSAESALYCRIITEGLFGVTPAGFDAFRCSPRLPDGWESMALRSLRAFGREFDLVVAREGNFLTVSAWMLGEEVFTGGIPAGGEVMVRLR